MKHLNYPQVLFLLDWILLTHRAIKVSSYTHKRVYQL